jgi:hypothetical protein
MNSAGTASTTLDFGEPSVDRTVAIDDLAKTADLKEIGVGQTWQNVSGSRTSGTTYTNSTGKPIMVSVTANNAISSIILTVGGVQACMDSDASANVNMNVMAIVPNGASYSVNTSTISNWVELR